MEALYLLVPMSVVVVFFTIWLFFNASDGGQFDDLVGPGMRILQDDDSTGNSIGNSTGNSIGNRDNKPARDDGPRDGAATSTGFMAGTALPE